MTAMIVPDITVNDINPYKTKINSTTSKRFKKERVLGIINYPDIWSVSCNSILN